MAATFDEEPTQDDINFSIVECLEGSDKEDEIVAQQMQQALEAGQLDRVADMMGLSQEDIEKAHNMTAKTSTPPPEADDDHDNKSDGDDDNNTGTEFYNDFD